MEQLISLLKQFFGRQIQIGTATLSVTWSALFFSFVLPVVGIFLSIRVLVYFVKRLVAKSQLGEEARRKVLKWFRISYRLVFVLAVALLAAALLGDQIVESLSSVLSFLREPFFTSGNTRVSVVTLLLLIPIFYVATWAGNASRRVLEHGVLERLSLDPSRRFSVVSLVRYGVISVVVVIGLSIVGINLSSLAVIFGVLGIGLGFGLQGVVSNFFAGVIIIISRPIKEGDRIHIGELEGDVKHIRILYSVINTITNETLIIPNRQIVESNVHNQSYDDPSIILMTNVQVSYGSDLDKVDQVLLQVGRESDFRHDGREPRVLFRSFDDSGITVTLALPIRHATQRHQARSSVVMAIWRTFRSNGIEIPFPQRDLHLRTLPPAIPVLQMEGPSPAGRLDSVSD